MQQSLGITAVFTERESVVLLSLCVNHYCVKGKFNRQHTSHVTTRLTQERLEPKTNKNKMWLKLKLNQYCAEIDSVYFK